MINTASGIVLLVIAVAAFNNYERGTLGQWLRAKFLNEAAPAAPGQRLVSRGSGGAVTGAGAAAEVGASVAGAGVEVVSARGIRVAKSIAPTVAAMVDAAARDGVTLTGGGYRSTEQQKALRIAHGCGGSKLMDRKCKGSPPTAVPGTSQHERGLAIDFDNCRSRSTVVFRWLAANASTYGFKNLASEPWHWSTTGS